MMKQHKLELEEEVYFQAKQSSNQTPMDTSSKPKRDAPEERVEPRGKAGRPKMFRHTTERPNAEKRDGSEPEEERPQKRKNRNKEKQRLRLEARLEKEHQQKEDAKAVAEGLKETSNPEPASSSTAKAKKGEEPKERKGSKVRTTIHKPIIPSKVGIQKMYEEFSNAKNKHIITAEEFKEFNEIFK